MCCSLRLRLGLAAISLLLAGCSQSETPLVERLAIIPPENLSPDPSLDWVGHSLAAILTAEAAGASDYHVFRADSTQGAVNLRATRVLRGYFDARGDEVEMHLFLEDLGRRKILTELERRSPLDGLVPLSAQLGDELAIRRRPFGSDNLDAVRSYGLARANRDPTGRDAALPRLGHAGLVSTLR